MITEPDRPDANPGVTPAPGRSRPSARFLAMTAGLLAVGIALGVGVSWLAMHRGGGPRVGASAGVETPLYQCPMHPTITSDHPGECPICGMKLVEVKGETKAAQPVAV